MRIQKQYSFEADFSCDGMRADTFLASQIQDLSRSALTGPLCSIVINGKESKKSDRVHSNDTVELSYICDVFEYVEPQDIPLNVIYEDNDMLVIDKAQGMVVHPGAGNITGTVVNALAYRYGQSFIDSMADECDISRPGIVHRLDKDTSGILVIALNARSHAVLASQFHDHSAEKHYSAVCGGFFTAQKGEIKCFLGRDPRNRKLFCPVKSGGKDSFSEYAVQRQYPQAALVDVRIHTGRTHQIRVHMKSIGHPVAGDVLYGPTKGLLGDVTLMLHSTSLVIRHPGTGEEMKFCSPLPERFAMLEERLSQKKW